MAFRRAASLRGSNQQGRAARDLRQRRQARGDHRGAGRHRLREETEPYTVPYRAGRLRTVTDGRISYTLEREKPKGTAYDVDY